MPKEAWNRVKELMELDTEPPDEEESERKSSPRHHSGLQDSVAPMGGPRVRLLFLLTGLVKLFWQIWGRIFDILLNMIGL